MYIIHLALLRMIHNLQWIAGSFSFEIRKAGPK